MLLCRTLKPNDKFSGIKAPSNELRQQSSRSSRDQSELYFQYFVTNIALCTTLKPNGKISGNLWVQQSQVKKKKKRIGNVTVKNYLKESLSTILCIILQGKGSSGKGLNLKYMVI